LKKISKFLWGSIFLFFIFPIGLFYLFIIPELVVEDVTVGFSLIKSLDILHGLAILTRPIWVTIILGFSVALLVYAKDLGNMIVRWFSDR